MRTINVKKRWLLLLLFGGLNFVLWYAVLSFDKEKEDGRALVDEVTAHIVKDDTEKVMCPKGVVLLGMDGGRTGEVPVWEYLSTLAVSRTYPELPFVPYVADNVKRGVDVFFENTSIPGSSELKQACRPKKSEEVYMISRQNVSEMTVKGRDYRLVVLAMWSLRYGEVGSLGLKAIREELRFKREHVEFAKRTLDKIRSNFNKSDPVYVCMHYRANEYGWLMKLADSKYKSPTYEYYAKAMRYFKDRYEDVIFVMITKDYSWLSTNLKHLDGNIAVNPTKGRTVEDYVLLAHCDHNIISYGPFASSAALLNGGTTIVYDWNLMSGPSGSVASALNFDNWFLIK